MKETIVIAMLLIFGDGCVANIHIDTATLIAFDGIGEPRTQPEEEALAHQSFAIQNTQKCLTEGGVATELARTGAARVRLLGAPSNPTVAIPADPMSRIGVILVAPDKAPRLVYGPAGPSSLAYELQLVAATYFDVPNCASFNGPASAAEPAGGDGPASLAAHPQQRSAPKLEPGAVISSLHEQSPPR